MRRNFRETAHTTLFNGVMKFVLAPAVCRSWTGHGFCCLMLIALLINWHFPTCVCVVLSLYWYPVDVYSNCQLCTTGCCFQFFRLMFELITQAIHAHFPNHPVWLSRVHYYHRMYAVLQHVCVSAWTRILSSTPFNVCVKLKREIFCWKIDISFWQCSTYTNTQKMTLQYTSIHIRQIRCMTVVLFVFLFIFHMEKLWEKAIWSWNIHQLKWSFKCSRHEWVF